MYSFDFDEIYSFNQQKDYESIGQRLTEEALKLENAGAEFLILCANTAHKWANEVKSKINIPLVHIADATGKSITDTGLKRVLLLGTNLTMEGEFIKGKLLSDFDIHVVVPEAEDRNVVSDIIYDELIMGKFLESSRQKILKIMKKFDDIEGVILGCTELPLIIKPEDTPLHLFNTTELHAKAAVDLALS